MGKRKQGPMRVTTLRQLASLVAGRRSVYVPGCWGEDKPVSAAFVISMQARTVLSLFDRGMYVYEPKSTKRFGRK